MKKITLVLVGLAIMAMLIPTTIADPDLTVGSLSRTRNSSLYYTICYTIRNCGSDDLVDATFTDASYIYNDGYWSQLGNSVITHTNFDLPEDQYSGSFCFNFYSPSGIHAFSVWLDIYDEISEESENNNDVWRLWTWY